MCDTVEDEFNFVMICPLYNSIRCDLFNEINVLFPFISQYSLHQQFLFLMGFDDYKLHYILSKFISDAFNIRSGVVLTPLYQSIEYAEKSQNSLSDTVAYQLRLFGMIGICQCHRYQGTVLVHHPAAAQQSFIN